MRMFLYETSRNIYSKTLETQHFVSFISSKSKIVIYNLFALIMSNFLRAIHWFLLFNQPLPCLKGQMQISHLKSFSNVAIFTKLDSGYQQ